MKTDRLELIPATVESCDAEMRGPDALAGCLRAQVPGSWPPAVFEPDDVARIRTQLEADPAIGPWTLHYVLTGSGDERGLVGVAGYEGPPTADGHVAIGYAIAPEYQRRGYASEAVNALVSAALVDPRVRLVRATTYPALQASIGVLIKTGFVQVGSESADGTITFERRGPGAGH